MKLIASLTSPYVRKVRIVLAEKKIDCDLVLDSPWVEGNQVAAVNPLGKIPVLVLDDESTLYDSRVIAEYLDTVAPNNRLIPASGRERISVKRWEALADGVLDAAVAAFLEAKRPDGERSPAWIERQRGKVSQALKVMSDDLGGQPWCHGSSLSLADVAVGCALGYVSFRLGDMRWREQYPNLAHLYDKLMQRPAFADTVPQG
ncbi:MAG: glutathione S-transferase N-terminal domain-containing protein [Sulfuritalea sp.]|jgi:glutathione S-transferase|nr:glutathione S-transferase N-terminal domain-containing protein [Sulfuritalea sp.]